MASILPSRLCTRALATSYARALPRISTRSKSSSSSPKPQVGATKDPVQPISDASKKPGNPSALSLDIDIVPEEVASTGAGRTGAKSSKNSLSSFEKRRRAMGRFALGAFGIGLGFGIFYLGREWEEGEKSERSSEDLGAGRWGRTHARLTETTDIFVKPQWKELLPAPMPPPHQKPFTLLLSLDDLLITSVWDREHGWRTAKRPGVDYFLGYLSQFYEIVIFTTQPHYTAVPIVDLLDRYRFFMTYHLFRESTRVVDGKIVKDLSYLNRDLSKVILLDTHADHAYTHPENAIILPAWKGDAATSGGLVGLIPFLESVAFFNTPDVRPVLTAYRGKDIAHEYAKHEEVEKQKFLEDWRRKGGSRSGASSLSFSSLFGGSQSLDSGPEPLTYLELKRKEAQIMYMREQQYIKENEPILEKARQEDMDKMREGAGSLIGWLENMTGKPPPDAQAASDPLKPTASTPPKTP